MNQFNERLFFRLTGENVSPESLSASELAEIITAHEKVLLAEMKKDKNSSFNEDNILSLVEIQKGSITLAFQPHFPVQTALASITEAIKNLSFDRLASKSVECLKTIQKITKRHQMVAEFCTTQGIAAKITPEMPITAKTLYISGETTLYGKIERVGGKEPKVWLEMSDEMITCEIDESLVVELANYLYQWVSVFGEAKWNVSNYKIKSFKIMGINKNYQDIPLNEALSRLSQEIGHYYDNIDPVEYIKTLRSDD